VIDYIYIRVSSENQAKQTSPEKQRKILMEVSIKTGGSKRKIINESE